MSDDEGGTPSKELEGVGLCASSEDEGAAGNGTRTRTTCGEDSYEPDSDCVRMR